MRTEQILTSANTSAFSVFETEYLGLSGDMIQPNENLRGGEMFDSIIVMA
jgi:hypothetical protein